MLLGGNIEAKTVKNDREIYQFNWFGIVVSTLFHLLYITSGYSWDHPWPWTRATYSSAAMKGPIHIPLTVIPMQAFELESHPAVLLPCFVS